MNSNQNYPIHKENVLGRPHLLRRRKSCGFSRQRTMELRQLVILVKNGIIDILSC